MRARKGARYAAGRIALNLSPVGEALGFLATGISGVLAVRYAVPVVAALERLNEATYRKLPRPLSRLGKRPSAAYALMTLMLAGCGYICIVTGVVGLIYALDAEFR